ADVGLELLNHFFIHGGDVGSLIMAAGSVVVLPFWAGVRVARVGGRWYWGCVGGLCVFASAALVQPLFDPSLAKLSLAEVVVAFLYLPLYALFGFLGGKCVSRRINGA